MGLFLSKFLRRRVKKGIDKANFTSDFSLGAWDNGPRLSSPSSAGVSPLACGSTSLCAAFPAASMSVLMWGSSEERGGCISENIDERETKSVEIKKSFSRTKHQSVYRRTATVSPKGDYLEETESYQIEKLGINKTTSLKGKVCYNCILYVPECDLIMVHYLTLYRLRLDTLSQYDFEKLCYKLGHLETLKKYSTLVRIYEKLKGSHFRDAFIINRIVSRQNVYFKITDLFGDKSNHLRAVIVIGERRSIIQNVIDSYCFAIKGKVAFIIKSADDYKKYINSSIPLKAKNLEITRSFISNNCRIVKSRLTLASKSQFSTTSNIYSNDCELANIPPNSMNDSHINTNATSNIKSHVQEYKTCFKEEYDVEDICCDNAIYSDGGTYNLVSIIADSTYAYILCRNSDMTNENYDGIDLSLINEEDISLTEGYGLNQSNSCHRITALKKLLRKEIVDCCNRKLYGIPFSKIPTDELYVVKCCINRTIFKEEKLLNNILIQNNIYGKVMTKQFPLNHQNHEELVIKLYGNESQVKKCCKELAKEGLARNFVFVNT